MTTEEERRALLEGWRERNETVRALLADVREHLASSVGKNRDAYRRTLLERINVVLEGGK